MPFVSPETTIGDVPVLVNPPGEEVILFCVMGEPLSKLFVNVMLALVLPPVAAPIVGATGTSPSWPPPNRIC